MAGNHFSTIATRRRRGPVDAELELRSPDAAAISATTAETPKALLATKVDLFKVALGISAYSSYSAGTAEWAIEVQVSDASDGTYVTVASYTPVGAAIDTEVAVSGLQIAALEEDAAYIRVRAVKTGSPGDLDYFAYIVPC